MLQEKLSLSDIDSIRQLQPEGWADITDAFKLYCSSGFCHPIKMTLNGAIVGVGNAIFFGHTAWLSHVIVDSNHRKQGVGNKIVDSLLTEIGARGIETSLLIATDLGEPVYVKAGFRKVSDYCFFKKESSIIDKQISDKIQPYRSEFYNDVIQLDAYISGENRETLLTKYIDQSVVFISNKAIEGYYMPNLGEGLVFALTADAGRELMRLKYSTVDHAVIPVENQVGIEILRELGFCERNTKGKRMIFGRDINWRPEMVYGRIGGNMG